MGQHERLPHFFRQKNGNLAVNCAILKGDSKGVIEHFWFSIESLFKTIVEGTFCCAGLLETR